MERLKVLVSLGKNLMAQVGLWLLDSAGGGEVGEVDMDVFVRFFVGTRGDMMPGVGICKALEARGHEVPFQSWTFRYIYIYIYIIYIYHLL